MSPNKFTIQKSFAISAGAGSGKTYTLSRRYINALLGFDYFRECYETDLDKECPELHPDCFGEQKPARVKEIVTITYTEAAALEMKGRIFELVSMILDFKALWQQETQKKENDPDYSIDGDLVSIKEANDALGGDTSKFEHIEETLQKALAESSFAKISTIHSFCLDIIKANADIARIDTRLDIIKEDEKAALLSKIIYEVLNDSSNETDVMEISKYVSTHLFNALIDKYIGSAKFRQDFDGFDEKSIDQDTYKELIRELYPLPDVSEVYEELQKDEARHKWFETYRTSFELFDARKWGGLKEGEKAPSLGIAKFPVTDEARKTMDKFVSHYAFVDKEKEELFFSNVKKIKSLLHQIKERYDAKLKEKNKTDFDTIISRTAEIVPDIKHDYRYIMVDEFQDTNLLQYEIVKNAAKGKNLFVVGDSKQSIYAFQGAEIEVFNNAVKQKPFSGDPVDMSVNFRSDGVVLHTVNRIFDSLLKKDDSVRLVRQNFEATPQELEVSKKEKDAKGSFRYLVTFNASETEEKTQEMETIAQFIDDLVQGKQAEYKDISDLISEKKKAVAILFDSRTEMLELKQQLKERGIDAKVSASENFYHTREINDIFNVLKAAQIINQKSEAYSSEEKYYLAGAMRSNLLRIDDNRVRKYLENGEVDEKLRRYAEAVKSEPLSVAVKRIIDDANVMGVYAHLDDQNQRLANLNKFLRLCIEFEQESDLSLRRFLKIVENAIYFSDSKEDEAFYRSENTNAVELCTIHATKGLAYPLVLLANAHKSLMRQVTSESLKHNNFEIEGKRKEIVGFKIGGYVPLSLRVLRALDKQKHWAEKKRLLYVALTRAEHHVVISARLDEKKGGAISLSNDSYLAMIIDSLGIKSDSLLELSHPGIVYPTDEKPEATKKTIEYAPFSWQPITFENKRQESATGGEEGKTVNEQAARLGTTVHGILERYWKTFGDNEESILDKMEVFDPKERASVRQSLRNFYDSELYGILHSGTEHYFEKAFAYGTKRGVIDLIYYDGERKGWMIVDFKTGTQSKEKEAHYQKQLEFYEEAMREMGFPVAGSGLLWL